MLIRHKRLYLVCTQEIVRYLSYPEPAYVSRVTRAQDKAGQEVVAARTISSPRTIVYVLTMIRVKVHEARQDNKQDKTTVTC